MESVLGELMFLTYTLTL